MNWKNKVRRLYNYGLYPKIKSLRGATRITSWMDRLTVSNLEPLESEPVNIFDEDWDNLIILDACRHDLYEKVNGETDRRISVGSNTPEFIERTFSSGDFSDIVYITANPHFHTSEFKNLTGRDVEETFHCVFHVYQTEWDESKSTVMPEKMVEKAKTAEKLFPEKKKIIHFMQPHYPFLDGELSKEGIRADLDHEREGESVWDLAEKGVYSREEVWKEYRNNLETVMPTVKELSEVMKGKTVVTSDHGNLVGENGLFGHSFKDVNVKKLREVPWDVISKG